MALVPNQVYTAAFSFVGFILCAVPFFWRLEGTSNVACMLMTRNLMMVQLGTPALARTWPGQVLAG